LLCQIQFTHKPLEPKASLLVTGWLCILKGCKAMKRMKTDEERRREAEEWNNWQPGSGRKGWSPFTKPVPPVRDGDGRPLKNGTVDWNKWAEEIEQGKWTKNGGYKP
jgi:hypothetical protein